MVGAWCLLKGLQSLLSLSPSGAALEKSKDVPPKGKTAEVPKVKDTAAVTSKTSSGKRFGGHFALAVRFVQLGSGRTNARF